VYDATTFSKPYVDLLKTFTLLSKGKLISTSFFVVHNRNETITSSFKSSTFVNTEDYTDTFNLPISIPYHHGLLPLASITGCVPDEERYMMAIATSWHGTYQHRIMTKPTATVKEAI